MKKVLILVDWYLPGYKAGGQIQSCANLTNSLKDKVDIYLLTSDRDLGDESSYPGIIPNEWRMSAYGYKIQYLSPENIRYSKIKKIIKEVNADCLYLNSMFSLHFTILALRAAVYNSGNLSRIVLAPRGMLHEGALQFKKIKKQFFLKVFRLLGIHHKIVFHATDAKEEMDIRSTFGQGIDAVHVNDFPSSIQGPLEICEKNPGSLNCIFVSRISPKKNLSYLLDRITGMKGNIKLTIIGPVEDETYWKACRAKIAALPPNILVDYHGSVPNKELNSYYKSSHLFFLPTHGENFGHVIFESLLSGRPVLISDQTPWKPGENGRIGWSIPLSQPNQYLITLQTALAWTQDEFDAACRESWKFAADYINGSQLKNQYLKLLTDCDG